MSIVKVNQEKCIGCGACVAIAPENFDFNDDGISTVINEEANEQAKEAEEVCPVCAIDIVEDSDKAKVTDKKESKSDEKSVDKHGDEDCCDKCECDDCECDDCECDDCECEECECDGCGCNDDEEETDSQKEKKEKGE